MAIYNSSEFNAISLEKEILINYSLLVYKIHMRYFTTLYIASYLASKAAREKSSY